MWWLVVILVTFPGQETIKSYRPIPMVLQEACKEASNKIYGTWFDEMHTLRLITECHPDNE
jgi:hypothetical protein